MSDEHGKVFRVWDSIKGKDAQFYIIFSFRGEDFRLTGKFGYFNGEVIAEAKSKNGHVTWSNDDGDTIACSAIGEFTARIPNKQPTGIFFKQIPEPSK